MAVQLSLGIVGGPGEFDLIVALVRGGDIEVTLSSGQKCRVRISKREWWDLTGDKIELSPRLWAPLDEGTHYSPQGRNGLIVSEQIERHPVCGHLILKSTRYCTDCGRDRMGAEE